MFCPFSISGSLSLLSSPQDVYPLIFAKLAPSRHPGLPPMSPLQRGVCVTLTLLIFHHLGIRLSEAELIFMLVYCQWFLIERAPQEPSSWLICW